MKNRILLGLFLISFALVSFGQQTQLSSLYTNNYFMVNPAEAGYKNVTDVTLSLRRQWAGYTGAPSSAWITGSTALNSKMGLGATVIYDEMSFLKNIDAKIAYSYHLRLAADFKLSFGLSLGIIQNSVDYGDIMADDYTDAILTSGNFSGTVFDAQFGTVVNFKDFYFGVSLPQMLKPSNSLAIPNLETSYNLQSHLNVYASYNTKVAENVELVPAVFYRRSNASSQFDVFANFKLDKKVLLGVGYRQSAGLLFNVGLKMKSKFQVNYAYDPGRMGAASGTSGTHEIMLKMTLAKSESDVPETDGDDEEEKRPEKKVSNRF